MNKKKMFIYTCEENKLRLGCLNFFQLKKNSYFFIDKFLSVPASAYLDILENQNNHARSYRNVVYNVISSKYLMDIRLVSLHHIVKI